MGAGEEVPEPRWPSAPGRSQQQKLLRRMLDKANDVLDARRRRAFLPVLA